MEEEVPDGEITQASQITDRMQTITMKTAEEVEEVVETMLALLVEKLGICLESVLKRSKRALEEAVAEEEVTEVKEIEMEETEAEETIMEETETEVEETEAEETIT